MIEFASPWGDGVEAAHKLVFCSYCVVINYSLCLSVLAIYLSAPVLHVYINECNILFFYWTLYHYIMLSLSFGIAFVLKPILSDMTIALHKKICFHPPPFFWYFLLTISMTCGRTEPWPQQQTKLLAHCATKELLYPLLVCVYLSLWSESLVGNILKGLSFLTQSVIPCLLFRIFNPLTFKIIINI